MITTHRPTSEEDKPVTLTEFLLARIAEDEFIAHQGSRVLSGPAQYGHQLWSWGDHRLEIRMERVLAECAAKRRIVRREQMLRRKPGHPPYDGPLTDDSADAPMTRHPLFVAWAEEHAELVTDTPTLRDLASVYADHPDYAQEWRP